MGFRLKFSQQNQSSDHCHPFFPCLSALGCPDSIPKDFPSGFLLAMPALAADSGVVQFRAFNAGEELKAFLMPGSEAGPGWPPKKGPKYVGKHL